MPAQVVSGFELFTFSFFLAISVLIVFFAGLSRFVFGFIIIPKFEWRFVRVGALDGLGGQH